MVQARQVRLFRNGRSQAVRIPKEFELPGREATIRKVGDRLILEPARRKSLLQALAAMTPLAPGDEFPNVDETLAPLDEDPFGPEAGKRTAVSHRYLLDTNILADLARNPVRRGRAGNCRGRRVIRLHQRRRCLRDSLWGRQTSIAEAHGEDGRDPRLHRCPHEPSRGYRGSLRADSNPTRVGRGDDWAERPSDRGACVRCWLDGGNRERTRIPSSARLAGGELVDRNEPLLEQGPGSGPVSEEGSMALNPVAYTENVVRSFLRYQLTAYPFSDPRLHAQMRALLSLDETRRSPLLKGPYVSLSRPFREGAAVATSGRRRPAPPASRGADPGRDYPSLQPPGARHPRHRGRPDDPRLDRHRLRQDGVLPLSRRQPVSCPP